MLAAGELLMVTASKSAYNGDRKEGINVKGTILLVEDETALAAALQQEFQFEDYQVLTASDGEQAVDLFNQFQSQLSVVILDWMLPKLDGLGVLRRIRRQSTIPVIMLTAKSFVGDKVAGLRGGADDYVTKPFEIEELLARIEVVTRRQQPATPQKYAIKNLTLDQKSRQVIVNNLIVQLTPREFQLLLVLFQHIGQPCTRDELLDAVWGVDFTGQPNTVDVYIRLLRHKLNPTDPNQFIHTVRGVGYVLKGE